MFLAERYFSFTFFLRAANCNLHILISCLKTLIWIQKLPYYYLDYLEVGTGDMRTRYFIASRGSRKRTTIILREGY